MQKNCCVCGAVFIKRVTESKTTWKARKFCTHKCYSKDLKENKWKDQGYKEHMSEVHKGNPGYWAGKKRPKFDEQWRKNMARVPWNKGQTLLEYSGENSPSWKGESVGYHALHNWVAKHLGRPSLCKHCGRMDLKRYEWANLSKEYKRDLSDWVRLCKSCHNRFDETGKKAWISRRSR